MMNGDDGRYEIVRSELARGNSKLIAPAPPGVTANS